MYHVTVPGHGDGLFAHALRGHPVAGRSMSRGRLDGPAQRMRIKLDLKERLDMKKWIFWIVMLMVSFSNGGFFFGASFHAMQRGLDGVDNQAALLFIPFLWLIAAFVLILLNLYTLIRGIKMEKDQMICLMEAFRLSGLSQKARAGRIAFISVVCLFMLFGYSLFAAEIVWATAYALSGGVLLLLLYAWKKAAVQRGGC